MATLSLYRQVKILHLSGFLLPNSTIDFERRQKGCNWKVLNNIKCLHGRFAAMSWIWTSFIHLFYMTSIAMILYSNRSQNLTVILWCSVPVFLQTLTSVYIILHKSDFLKLISLLSQSAFKIDTSGVQFWHKKDYLRLMSMIIFFHLRDLGFIIRPVINWDRDYFVYSFFMHLPWNALYYQQMLVVSSFYLYVKILVKNWTLARKVLKEAFCFN